MPDAAPRQRQAVALRYRSGQDPAPRVVAKGRGHVADAILDIARRENVAVREDASLVEVLGKLDLDQVIPPELYEVLAKLLAWVYEQDRRYGRRDVT
jgi:flagellar biosynthesis protein